MAKGHGSRLTICQLNQFNTNSEAAMLSKRAPHSTNANVLCKAVWWNSKNSRPSRPKLNRVELWWSSSYCYIVGQSQAGKLFSLCLAPLCLNSLLLARCWMYPLSFNEYAAMFNGMVIYKWFELRNHCIFSTVESCLFVFLSPVSQIQTWWPESIKTVITFAKTFLVWSTLVWGAKCQTFQMGLC